MENDQLKKGIAINNQIESIEKFIASVGASIGTATTNTNFIIGHEEFKGADGNKYPQVFVEMKNAIGADVYNNICHRAAAELLTVLRAKQSELQTQFNNL